jgi:hypothetical protein
VNVLRFPVRQLDVRRAVLCGMALVNPATQNVTFVEVVHSLTVPAASLGEYVGLRAHFLIVGDGEFDVRVVWVGADGAVVRAGDACDRVAVEGATEFASSGVRLPPGPGEWHLALQWRPARGGDVSYANAPDLDGPAAGWCDGGAQHWIVVRAAAEPGVRA